MGDAIAHSVFPGLTIAYLLEIPLIIGAMISGVIFTVITGYLEKHSRIKQDALMGIVFSGMFALGLIIFTKIKIDINLLDILFGNLLGIRTKDFIQTSIIAIVCIIIMLLKRKDISLYCFDPIYSHVIGLKVSLIHFGFLILLAFVIVISLQVVGIMLVFAMLVAPGSIGILVARSFKAMLIIAVTSVVISSVFGTLISFHMNVGTGPLIVTLETAFFIVALCLNKYRIWRARIRK